MTLNINSCARALVRELFGEPPTWPQPQPDRDYETLVDVIAAAMQQVAAEAREAALKEAGTEKP